MPEAVRIRMDPLNPGQFFACCGLFDLLTRPGEELIAWFEVDERSPRNARFVLRGASDSAVQGVLRELSVAKYEAVEHTEKTVKPVRVRFGPDTWEFDWWLDAFREETTNLKCWAGQVTSIRLFEELAPLVHAECRVEELFYHSKPTKSKFGVDPRSAWNALDYGFSPDQHNQDAATYPTVELLAAVGLQGFRPDATKRRVGYALWTAPLAASVARSAAIAPWDGLPHSAYQFDIAKRGQSYKYFTYSEFMERKEFFA